MGEHDWHPHPPAPSSRGRASGHGAAPRAAAWPMPSSPYSLHFATPGTPVVAPAQALSGRGQRRRGEQDHERVQGRAEARCLGVTNTMLASNSAPASHTHQGTARARRVIVPARASSASTQKQTTPASGPASRSPRCGP